MVKKLEGVQNFFSSLKDKSPLKGIKLGKKQIRIGIILLLIIAFLYFAKGFFVAAFVNGWPITRIALIKELEREAGQQALDTLVTKNLVLQEARKRGIAVSQTEIEAALAEIETKLVDQGQDLDQILMLQGLTRKDFKDQIKFQLTAEKMFADGLTVSEEEFNQYITENKDYFEPETDFTAIRGDIEDQIKQQKLSQLFQDWLTQAKQEAKIKYFITF